jgi:hypothetical protein
MGRLNKQVLGFVDGKVGGYVIRRRYNKSVVYKLPDIVKVSQTPQAKKARAKFRPMSQFASYINSIPELKYFWMKYKLKASSAYHKILKENYPAFDYNRPTKSNGITPLGTMFGPATGASVTSEGFKVENFIRDRISFLNNNEKAIMAIGVMCFYDPIKKKQEYFTLSKTIIESVNLKFGEPFKIVVPFDEQGKCYYTLYRTCILYFTLVTKDSTGKPLRYSLKYSAEFTRNIRASNPKPSR